MFLIIIALVTGTAAGGEESPSVVSLSHLARHPLIFDVQTLEVCKESQL
jgi:hypothetical protein